jgi:hypothetical protein
VRIIVCGPDQFCKAIAGPEARPNAYWIDSYSPKAEKEMAKSYYCQGLLKECGYKPNQVVIY